MKELNFIPDSVSQDSVFIPQASSPGPGFGCPTPAQAKQAFDQGKSSNPPVSQSSQSQSLAEANPNLLKALTQPIASSTSYSPTLAQSFTKPSFNLRPGTSKAEMASNGQVRPPIPQLRGYTPHPGLQASAYTQQQTRAFTPVPPTNDYSRATSTPLPSSDHNLAFMPPTSAQQSRHNQYPPNMAYQQHPGVPVSSSPQFPQAAAHSARSLSQPYPTPQSRMYQHQQTYSPYPQVKQSTRPKVAASYFNGSTLGTRNKKVSGDVGLLMDPAKQDWVNEQQEKYLRYHLRLYRGRGK